MKTIDIAALNNQDTVARADVSGSRVVTDLTTDQRPDAATYQSDLAEVTR
jgi:hypothetical protein